MQKAFQTDLYNDVQGLRRNFVNNPLRLENLAVINDTSQLFDDNIFHNIAKLESVGFMQLKAFIKDRLISCKTSINPKIALNHFILPNDEKSKKPHGQTAEKRLTTQFLTKLRDAVRHRREKAEMLFSTEIFGVSQCLSINGYNLYLGTKSNILQRFKPTEFPGNETSSAIIIKLSAIQRCSFNAITFNDFAGKIYAYIIDIATGYDRVGIVCNRYFEKSSRSRVWFVDLL